MSPGRHSLLKQMAGSTETETEQDTGSRTKQAAFAWADIACKHD